MRLPWGFLESLDSQSPCVDIRDTPLAQLGTILDSLEKVDPQQYSEGKSGWGSPIRIKVSASN